MKVSLADLFVCITSDVSGALKGLNQQLNETQAALKEMPESPVFKLPGYAIGPSGVHFEKYPLGPLDRPLCNRTD